MTPPVDSYCSLAHYVDHLAPIWHALPPEDRGTFHTEPRTIPRLRHHGITARPGPPRGPRRTVLVAGAHDVWKVRGHRVVLLEHGAGQGYEGCPPDPGWSGGSRREDVALFLVPNEVAAARNLARYPDTPNAVIGSPRVEYLRTIQREPQDKPTVALSFHWQGTGRCPAAGWALPHYEEGLPDVVRQLRASGYEVIGHGHPRARRHFARLWASLGIEHVERFEDVIRRASVYVVDNSSTGFEAAACGVPVVWLSCPEYADAERERWWPRWGNPGWWVGEQATDASQIPLLVRSALRPRQRPGWRPRAVAEVYPVIEGAAKLAVEAIQQLDT